jgi:DNA-binding phage protein
MKTRPFDPAVYLTTPTDRVDYLNDAFTTEDPAFIGDAFSVIARASGITAPIAAEPDLMTIMHIINTAGMRLHVEAR